MGILICNTRTDGQNPNILGANYSSQTGKLVPQLVVAGNNQLPSSLSFVMWDIVPSEPGGAYHLQITGNNNDRYFLAISSNPQSGDLCTLEPVSSFPDVNSCVLWMFPYPTRLLSACGIGMKPTNECLVLDAGNYPNPMVFNSTSSVNQTWMYGSSLNSLQTLPFTS